MENHLKFAKWISKTLDKPMGIIVLVLCFACLVSWQSENISKFPGLAQFAAWLESWPIPQADPTRFSVMVAHLQNDEDCGQEQLIIDALRKFDGIQVLSLNRTIQLEGADTEKMQNQGRESALRFLRKSGASVLIWGSVRERGDRSLPKLFWTAYGVREPKSRRYDAPRVEDQLRLPELMWSDLSEILGLLVASSASKFTAKEGQYVADRLPFFINCVRRLLSESDGRPGWDADVRSFTRLILANALTVLGDRDRKNEALQEAVAAYREALKERPRERGPFVWAATQNSLGDALRVLGERESGTGRLEEAVAAYREALKERPRETVPLIWAATQNNLGDALSVLGERESGTGRLEEAVTAYREALKVRIFDRVPLDWVVTQGTLNNALTVLPKGHSWSGRLEEAVVGYNEALRDPTLDGLPLDWATTQCGLCNALTVFGERESGTGRLQEALVSCKEALNVFESTHATHREEFAKARLRRAEALFQERRK